MKTILIAAIAENGVIGNNNEIPWHHPEDLKRFKELTLGHPVIMGRVTYESIVDQLGGPLPDRVNIVLTRNPAQINETETTGENTEPLASVGDGTEVHAATFPDEAIAFARSVAQDKAFVAGGATVYEQFLSVADRMEITEIHEEYDGDTTFPDINQEQWEEVDRDDREEISFVTYERKQ